MNLRYSESPFPLCHQYTADTMYPKYICTIWFPSTDDGLELILLQIQKIVLEKVLVIITFSFPQDQLSKVQTLPAIGQTLRSQLLYFP